jgi:hypothetical protein
MIGAGGVSCRIPYAILQGILEPNLITSREFESRSREFGALPEILVAALAATSSGLQGLESHRRV